MNDWPSSITAHDRDTVADSQKVKRPTTPAVLPHPQVAKVPGEELLAFYYQCVQ